MAEPSLLAAALLLLLEITISSGRAADRAPSGGGRRHAESRAAPVDEAAAAVARVAHKKRPAADPLGNDRPIFAGWPRPVAALFISGEQLGYLEPCGCAGLENQKGGLTRRHVLIRRLRRQGWPVVAIDLGAQVRRFGQQAVLKYRRSLESLVTLGYSAVGFGLQDLRLSTPELVAVVANIDPEANPLVAANVDLFEQGSGFVARQRVVPVAGRRIGVTSIVGKTLLRQLHNDDLVLSDPVEALEEILPALRRSADFLVLLSHATVEESTALARRFPDFDLVVTAGGAAEPPPALQPVAGVKTRIVDVGHKGMYVGVVGLFDDPKRPLRYECVPLDARFDKERSPEMRAMLVDYQKDLQTLGFSGLGLRSVPHPSGRRFVGSETCSECHTEAYAVWEKVPHAHATKTLVQLDPARHFDPECLSCHVTGWEPQKYYPYISGYLDLSKTAALRANGCENCHGPGSEHVAAEQGDIDADESKLEKLRSEMRLALAPGEAAGQTSGGRVGKVTLLCYECHDLDNSPDFDFKTYWPKVAHKGKE